MKRIAIISLFMMWLMVFQSNAMEKPTPSISPTKAIAELNLPELIASGALDSPLKKTPTKESKEEVASPSKTGGFTSKEIEHLMATGALYSPLKKETLQQKISPEGKFNVGYQGEHGLLVDNSMAQGSNIIATTFQIPNRDRLHAMDKPDTIFVTSKNAYDKDESRATDRVLPQLANKFKVYIFNPLQRLKGFNGQSVELHTKTFSWINRQGKPRVSGFGSDNVTWQARKNQEMAAYSKDPKDREEHENFLKRILPYCAEYNEFKRGAYKPAQSLFLNKVDYRTLPLPPLVHNEGKFYTDQYNVQPALENICNHAERVTVFSISEPYLSTVAKSNKLRQFIINKANFQEKPQVQETLKELAQRGVQVYVYDDPEGENHLKEIITPDTVWFSEGNPTEKGQSIDLNKNTFSKDPVLYKKCNEAFDALLRDRATKPLQSFLGPANSSAVVSQVPSLAGKQPRQGEPEGGAVKRVLFKDPNAN